MSRYRVDDARVLEVLTDLDKEMIRGLADHCMLVSEAANAAHITRNAVYYRIYRIEYHTGYNCKDFHDLTYLLKLIGEEKSDGADDL